MQTFLPYPNFVDTARCLDNRRLNKQIVECMQILSAIQPEATSRWRNHPAVLMWKGYDFHLKEYSNACYCEWIRRGYKRSSSQYELEQHYPKVPWLGDERFHSSHRSNLLRKHPEWYCKFGWIEPDTLPYFWPSKCSDYQK